VSLNNKGRTRFRIHESAPIFYTVFEAKNFGRGADSLPASCLLAAQEFYSELEENLHLFRRDDVFHNTNPEG